MRGLSVSHTLKASFEANIGGLALTFIGTSMCFIPGRLISARIWAPLGLGATIAMSVAGSQGYGTGGYTQ